MHNKLKKLLYTTLVGATMGVISSCKYLQWQESEKFDIEETGQQVITEPGGRSIVYKLEDLVCNDSELRVTALESKREFRIHKIMEYGHATTYLINYKGSPYKTSYEIRILGIPQRVIDAFKTRTADIKQEAIKIFESAIIGKFDIKDYFRIGDYEILITRESGIKNIEREVTQSQTEDPIYQDQKAQNIKLKLNRDFLFKNSETVTNSEGIGVFEFRDLLSAQKDTSKPTLERNIRHYVAREVKENFRDYFSSRLISSIKERACEIEVVTAEKSKSPTDVVTNDRIIGLFKIYELPPRASLASLIVDFVNNEINSKIKEVTLSLKDIDSHIPIEYADIEIKSNAPKKRELALQYFQVGEGQALDSAIEYMHDFIVGKDIKKFDESGVIRFSVYLPASIDAEITHKKYNFLQQNFKFEEDKLSKTIFMSELGQKMRVKIVDK